MWQKMWQLSSDTFVYGLSNAAGRFLSLFLVPIFTRVFAPAEYGVIDTLTTASAIAAAVLMLGLDTGAYICYFDATEEAHRRSVLFTWLVFEFALVGTSVTVSSLFSIEISRGLLTDQRYASLVRLTLLTLPFSSCLGIFLQVLKFRFAAVRYGLVSVGFTLANALLSIYLVVVARWGLMGVLWANVLANALFFAIGLILVSDNLSAGFSWRRLREMLLLGLPVVPANVAGWVVAYASRYFLLYLISLNEVGLFSVAGKLASLVALILAAFQTAWGPFSLSIAREEDAKQTYAKVLTYYLTGTSALALGLSLFAREILIVFTRPDYVAAYRIVGLLAFGLVANGVYYIVAVGVNIAKKTAHLSWTTGAAAAITIGANFLLTPRLGMVGAAAAALAGNVASTYLLYRVAQRYYHIPYETGKAGKIIGLGAIFLLAGVWINTGNTLLDLSLKAGLLMGFAGGLYACRVLEPRELAVARQAASHAMTTILSQRREG